MVKTIQDAILAIKSNELLSDVLKTSIADSLIEYYYVKKEALEDINLDSFCENIAKMSMGKISPFEPPVTNYKFVPKNNTLFINNEYFIDEETNQNNIGAQIMFDVLYINGEYTGFGIDGLSALNKGFRETLANNLCGTERVNEVPSDEYGTIILFATVFPALTNILFESYTGNKPINMVKFLKENNLEDLNRKVEYNSMSRNNSNGKSLLGEIQTELIRRYPEKKAELETVSITQEMHYGDPKYDGLASVVEKENIVSFPTQEVQTNPYEQDDVLDSTQKIEIQKVM